MALTIRDYRHSDEAVVVELSLRAWAPVFASLELVLGDDLSTRLHGDWREHQAAAVRETAGAEATSLWVAEHEGCITGFVAALAHPGRPLGEIAMLAVDPEHQSGGIGAALTEHATDWLRERGMHVAMVDTGGDAGHAQARRLYESAGFTALPVVRYFKSL